MYLQEYYALPLVEYARAPGKSCGLFTSASWRAAVKIIPLCSGNMRILLGLREIKEEKRDVLHFCPQLYHG